MKRGRGTYERFIRPLLFLLDAEAAHDLTIRLLGSASHFDVALSAVFSAVVQTKNSLWPQGELSARPIRFWFNCSEQALQRHFERSQSVNSSDDGAQRFHRWGYILQEILVPFDQSEEAISAQCLH